MGLGFMGLLIAGLSAVLNGPCQTGLFFLLIAHALLGACIL